MESNLSGFDFSVLLIDFVTDQDDGDVVADSGKVLVPLGNVFVGDSGGDVEHEDSSIGANVVSFSETSELLLSGGVPQGELDGAVVGVESDGADFNTLGGDVFLFKLSGNVSFDEGGFSDSTITDQDDFELGDDLRALQLRSKSYLHLLV